jgi:hypothetical protein
MTTGPAESLLLAALSASELGAEDVLVANEKQDCRDLFNPLGPTAIDLGRRWSVDA